MPYMVTFTINIPPMLAYIPYMDPMGLGVCTSLIHFDPKFRRSIGMGSCKLHAAVSSDVVELNYCSGTQSKGNRYVGTA
jgi:hypothetical protein